MTLSLVALPAELGSLEARLCGDALFWGARDLEVAGVGAAATIRAAGPLRFAEVRARGQALLDSIEVGADAPSPRLFGGFSFHAREPAAEWSAFGQALFVLPRLSFVREAGRSWACLIVPSGQRQSALDELGRALETVSRVRTRTEPPRAGREAASDPEFVSLVESIGRGIDSGRFAKVVAARHADLTLPAPADVAALVAALPRDSTRFALVQGGSAFIGATPERLVQRRGLDVRTEALAGSARANDAAALCALAESEKERAEHAIVRDAITGALAELGSVDFPPQPDVRALRHVAHLSTPIRARLREPCHVLELAERLHPTPAVGGEPRRAALAFLEREERIERGWYAAPFGWFDRQGDGELVVALRAGLLSGSRARLYAGAGIVRGSEPALELAETELKLAALREVVEAAW